MHRAIKPAVFLQLLLACILFAAAPPPPPLGTAEQQKLVDQLGDRDYRVREQAEKRLFTEGMPALPLLRKALAHPDPEVRRRALRLIPGLEHASLVSPRRVTMTVQDKPLRIILEDLSKVSGYKVMLMGAVQMRQPAPNAPAREPTFSYQFVNEPFWDVIDRLCKDSQLNLQQGYGDEMVRLFPANQTSPFVGRDGAFRYAATNLQLFRTVDLGNFNPTNGVVPPRTETLTLNLTLFSEPRLPFLGMSEVRLDAAYDSERNSMIPRAEAFSEDPNNFRGVGRRVYHGGYKQMSMQASMVLQRVSEKATSIKLLRGVVPVTLLVSQKPMTLTENFLETKGKKITVGELDFNIESAQKMPNNQYQVKLTITNKGNPNDYTWQNTLYQRLELFDDKGVKFQHWGSNWHGGGGNSVSLTLTFNGALGGAKAGNPTRLVYQHWDTRQHDIAFELRDLPLP
ncbi:MAG: HEAT repeat domain-containing protein [Gemmataceae bacterium]